LPELELIPPVGEGDEASVRGEFIDAVGIDLGEVGVVSGVSACHEHEGQFVPVVMDMGDTPEFGLTAGEGYGTGLIGALLQKQYGFQLFDGQSHGRGMISIYWEIVKKLMMNLKFN